MTKYTLPDLPYDYSALEPFVSGYVLELHHSKHHNAYVNGANQALEMMHDSNLNQDVTKVNQLSKNYAFNLGGHLNHSNFWQNLAPANGQEPTGELKTAIEEEFGSFNNFKTQFAAAAAGVQGSGWAVLGFDKLAQKLSIFQQFDHQGNLPIGIEPVVLLDVWEHAYYLDYKNMRPDYIQAWWNIVNWEDALNRYVSAKN